MDRVIFRYWGFRSPVSETPSDEIEFRWKPRFLDRASLHEIYEGPPSGYPVGLEEMLGDMTPFYKVGRRKLEVTEHIEDATEHIYTALLEPITEPLQEVYFLDLPDF